MSITINLWLSLSTSSSGENIRIHRKAFEKVTELKVARLNSIPENNIEAHGDMDQRI